MQPKGHRWLVAIGVGAAVLLVAGADSPAGESGQQRERQMTIRGSALQILPAEELSYLRFSGGVTAEGRLAAEGQWFILTADVAELDVKDDMLAAISGITGSPQPVELGLIVRDWSTLTAHCVEPVARGNARDGVSGLPSQADVLDRLVRDPGETITEMSQELKLPHVSLKDSQLQRIGAAGQVSLTIQIAQQVSLTLTTASLVSVDGGRSWAAEQRSRLDYGDSRGEVRGWLAADYLLYDDGGKRALAWDNITGEAAWGGSAPLTFSAQSCEMDLETQMLEISEGLLLRAGELEMCCGVLNADLGAERLQAAGSPRLTASEHGVVLTAQTIDVEMRPAPAEDNTELEEWAIVVARGGVEAVIDPQRLAAALNRPPPPEPAGSAILTAGEVRANLAAQTMTATGEPLLTYGSSSYRGQMITVSWEDKGYQDEHRPSFVQQRLDVGGLQWTDARFDADRQDVIQVTAYGEVYMQLLGDFPKLGEYLSQGEQVTLVVADDLALQTVSEEVTNTAAEIDRLRTALGTVTCIIVEVEGPQHARLSLDELQDVAPEQ